MRIIINVNDETLFDALESLNLIGGMLTDGEITDLVNSTWFNNIRIEVDEGPVARTLLMVAAEEN